MPLMFLAMYRNGVESRFKQSEQSPSALTKRMWPGNEPGHICIGELRLGDR